MHTEKQKWVEDVLNSTDGLVHAEAPDMTDAVMSRIGSSGRYSISPASDNSLIWKIAASVALLLLLNGVTIYSYQEHRYRAEKNNEMRNAASELGIVPSSSDPGTVIFGN